MAPQKLDRCLGANLETSTRSKPGRATHLQQTLRVATVLLFWSLIHSGESWEGQIKFADYGILVSPVEYEHVAWDIDLNLLSKQAIEYADSLEKHTRAHLKNSTWSKHLKARFRHQIGPLITSLRHEGQRIRALVKDLRTKRSLGVILAIGASIAAVGSSIYTIDKVHGLEGTLKTSTMQIELNGKNLMQTKAIVSGILRKQEDKLQEIDLVENVRWQVHGALNTLIEVRKGLNSLLRHEVPVGLLNQKDIEKASYALKTSLSDEVQTLFPIEESLRMSPASWIIKGNSIKIFIHVPIIRDRPSCVRNLYELVGAYLPGNKGVVKILSPEPFIAVSPGQATHTPVSNADLALCYKHGKLFLCDNLDILYSKPSSCIGSLFYKDTSLAVRKCALEHAEPSKVVKVSRDAYLFKGGQSITYHCHNLQPYTRHFLKPEEIKLTPGCSVEGDGFIIYPRRSMKSDAVSVKHKITWEDISLLEDPKFAKLQMALRDMKMGGNISMQSSHSREIFYILIAFFILLLASVVGYAVYGYHRITRGMKIRNYSLSSSGENVESDTLTQSKPATASKKSITERMSIYFTKPSIVKKDKEGASAPMRDSLAPTGKPCKLQGSLESIGSSQGSRADI